MTPALARAGAAALLFALAPQLGPCGARAEEAPRPTPLLVLARIGEGPSAPTGFGVLGLPGAAVAAAATRAWSRDQWRTVLSVQVERADAAPVLGDYRVALESLWMVPAFPPAPGIRYRVVFRPEVLAALLAAGPAPPGDGGATPNTEASPFRQSLAAMSRTSPIVAELSLDAAPRGEATEVEAVFPGVAVVPENLLRLYVTFSGSMSRGGVHRWIRLEDARGRPIERAFLELAEELWDRDGRRLTLLLDPGRIKTGLVPRQEEGPALAAGHDVFLAIDRRWPDAAGWPLAAARRSGFRVGPRDHEPPDPLRWLLAPPPAGSREPLVVELDEPLDHALLHRMVWVENNEGDLLQGSIQLGKEQRSWAFYPDAPWRSGTHALRVDRRLEDLAGNRVGRAFEVDLERPRDADQGDQDRPVGLPFTISR